MIRARTNLVSFNAAIDQVKASMVPHAITHAEKVAAHVVEYMADNAPHDTGKFKRGILLAGRDLGIGSRPLPTLTASRYANKLKSVLIRQMLWFQRAIQKLEDREREVLAGIAAKRSKRTDAYVKRQKSILAKKAATGARTRKSIQTIYGRNSGRTRIK